MVVAGQPIGVEAGGDLSQEMTGEMGDAHPGEDEEAGVIGDLVEMGLPVLRRPADEEIPGFDRPCRSAEEEAGQGAVVTIADEVFQVFADGGGEAEIVIALKKVVK